MYTITLMHSNRTDLRPKTIYLSRAKLLGMLAFFVGVPLVGFALAYFIVAPYRLGVDVAAMRQERAAALAELAPLQAQYDLVFEENADLRSQLQNERQQVAELEARITITETAKTEANAKMRELEQQLAQTEHKLSALQELMKPANAQAPLQCFNITADYANKTLTYGINFLKNNTKDTSRLELTIALRILTGENGADVGALSAATGSPDHTREIALTKDYRLTGKFTTPELPESGGLRILDIKGYDGKNQVQVHCWKAF